MIHHGRMYRPRLGVLGSLKLFSMDELGGGAVKVVGFSSQAEISILAV